MAGNKNSGRRPSPRDMEIRLRVIQRSWEILEEQLNDPLISAEVKRDIALKVAPKTIPTELTGGFNVTPVAMGTITIDGKIAEFDIGSPVCSPSDPEPAGEAPPANGSGDI